MEEIDVFRLNPETGKDEHILAKRIDEKKWFIQANPFSGLSGEILKDHLAALKFIERADYLSDDPSCCGYIYRERGAWA